MKVRTFTAGLVCGFERAFEALDKDIAEKLGENITIHSVTDSYRIREGKDVHTTPFNEVVARVVVYSEAKQYWKVSRVPQTRVLTRVFLSKNLFLFLYLQFFPSAPLLY